MNALRTPRLLLATGLLLLLLGTLLLFNYAANAQSIGIGTAAPDPSALLELKSNKKGLLVPRLLQADRQAIPTPAKGLLVFQTDGTTPGLYYYTGSMWAVGTLPVGGANQTLRHDGAGWVPTTNFTNDGTRVGIGTAAPLVRLSVSPNTTEAKITLWDGGSALNHYGFGVSANQLNYHVDGTASAHVFYSGGKNGNGTELMRLLGNGQVSLGAAVPPAGRRLHVYYYGPQVAYFGNGQAGGTGLVAEVINGDGVGVQGIASATPGVGLGGYFDGGETGVRGSGVTQGGYFQGNLGVWGNGTTTGGYFTASSVAVNGTTDCTASGVRAIGVSGTVTGTGNSLKIGIYGLATGPGTRLAGLFDGDVQVSGNLSKSGGTFRIDHPQDPAHKYLIHSFVESPEMLNLYAGTVTTDAQGRATVQLPPYFEAENVSCRYQLTVVGQFAQAIIGEKVKNNTFVIRTDKPAVEVCWQVSGVRNDPWAQQHPIIPEKAKEGADQGKYLHPEVYNRPATDALYPAPVSVSPAALPASRRGVGR